MDRPEHRRLHEQAGGQEQHRLRRRIEVRRSSLQYPVVGIGAPAGGMAAALQLFEQLPDDPGMALVVVLHLSPHCSGVKHACLPAYLHPEYMRGRKGRHSDLTPSLA